MCVILIWIKKKDIIKVEKSCGGKYEKENLVKVDE